MNIENFEENNLSKNVFCTLFDSNYVDKGLTLIESLEKNAKSFRLYVLAMDDKCEEILSDKDYMNVTIISLKDFEDEELLKAKKNRSRAEYNWTCSACLIDYVFETFNEAFCTYIDADMYFYSNPVVLIDEMIKAQKSVQIIEHRFSKSFYGYYSQKNSGKYCVEFNTFYNDIKARKVLSDWKSQVLNSCKASDNGKSFGDQMYLNDWLQKYDCVHVLKHPGAGLALWNMDRYSLVSSNEDEIFVKMDRKIKARLVFYHFHNVCYLAEDKVDIGVASSHWRVDDRLVKILYSDYLRKTDQQKKYVLEKYGFIPLIVKHPALVEENGEEVRIPFREKIYNLLVEIDRRAKKKVNGRKDLISI